MLKLNHNLVYSFKLLTVFIHGIFITALFFLVISSNYETHIYKQILEATDIKSLSDEDKILKIQESTYNRLGSNRL